jgi:UDP:flavonoid glycosyltransferase YjiC (YdhE family)
MARFLFVPVPVAEHLGPALALARGVVARGHQVTVYTSARYRAAVERAGATFTPFTVRQTSTWKS